MFQMDERRPAPERRVFRRADVSRPLQLEILAGSANSPVAQIEGETVNVGCGGIAAKINGLVIPGSSCRVRIWDSAEATEPDEIEGVICWSEALNDGAFVGIEFESRLDAMRHPVPMDESAQLGSPIPAQFPPTWSGAIGWASTRREPSRSATVMPSTPAATA